MATPRVAITQRVEIHADIDERRDALDQRWGQLLIEAGCLPIAIPNGLDDPAEFLREIDPALLILSGGNDLAHLPDPTNAAPERDRTEAALIDAATMDNLPLLAVCRGMQMLVDHLGGQLERGPGHRATPHRVTVVDNRWPLADARLVNSYHDWVVPRVEALPPTLVPLAVAPDGTVEAVGRSDRPHVGIMWHPERPAHDAADTRLLWALLEARR